MVKGRRFKRTTAKLVKCPIGGRRPFFNFYRSNVAAVGANEGLQGGKGSKFRRCSHKCHRPTANFTQLLANIF